MRCLKFPFEVLTLTGMWLPLHWESKKLLKFCYHLYTSYAILLSYLFVSLQVFLLLSSEFNVNFFADIMFTLVCSVSVLLKSAIFVLRRNKVIQLAEMLVESYCLPRNSDEMEMQRKTDLFIRNFTIIFNVLGQTTIFSFLIVPLFQDPLTRDLPFRMWLPYDLHSGWNYWITYSLEVVPMIISILLNVTIDVVVSGFVLQACTQLDLLYYRLDKFSDLVSCAISKGHAAEDVERKLLKHIVIHHKFVIRFADKVTKTFDVIIVEIFFASVFIFSVIVYQFTMGDIPTLQKITSVGYIIAIAGELFAFCWFGNEITLKSTELGEYVYMINWTTLSPKAIKALIFIMMKASRPIIMSYGDLIVLNIESFKSIMKISYSAINVLRESGAK